METKEERVWNCKSSTFCLSLRELRKPGFRFEKALSSGAKRVTPEEDEAMSCELSWLMSCVVFSKRMRTENLFALVRIWTMSMAAEIGAPTGDAGTRGTVFIPCGCCVVIGGDASGGDGF
ncbi:hypothetical protein Fmac_019631 [Flemingia macrophylla]|uniref:Uncharacterized protein n=1 Tax=Flemingia macrophylla TaxID=520843 RepID=A0ABD1M8G4_9FABA